jgi:hypothetical protein
MFLFILFHLPSRALVFLIFSRSSVLHSALRSEDLGTYKWLRRCYYSSDFRIAGFLHKDNLMKTIVEMLSSPRVSAKKQKWFLFLTCLEAFWKFREGSLIHVAIPIIRMFQPVSRDSLSELLVQELTLLFHISPLKR